MKRLLVILVLLSSSAAFAISNTRLIEKCADTGLSKLMLEASADHCTADGNQLTVREIDNRISNPSKYVWYSLPVKCDEAKKELVTLVQYNSLTGKCL